VNLYPYPTAPLYRKSPVAAKSQLCACPPQVLVSPRALPARVAQWLHHRPLPAPTEHSHAAPAEEAQLERIVLEQFRKVSGWRFLGLAFAVQANSRNSSTPGAEATQILHIYTNPVFDFKCPYSTRPLKRLHALNRLVARVCSAVERIAKCSCHINSTRAPECFCD
jgi:hypothetical protein